MVCAVFFRVAAPRTKSSLWSKSLRNLGSMAKIFLHALLILKKHMAEYLGINFGRFCTSMALMVNCCMPFKSFYCRPKVCVRVNGRQSKPFHVGVGLRQGCVLSPLLFIVYINWIDKKYSQANECATVGNCKISRLLFADDLVQLSSTESGLQRALNSFADACNTAGMKISTAKTEVLHLSRNPDQCLLQVNGATLKQVEKFKYLGVAFTSDERQDEELDTRIGKASAVMRALHYSVVMKRELSKKAKLSIFKAFFVPILTYGHESWVMTKRVRSQVQASEMRFLRRIEGVTLFNKVRSSEIQKSLNIEPLLLRIERSQLRWFGNVSRMPQERLPKQLYLPKQMGDDQLDDLELMDRLHWESWMEPLRTSPKRNDGGDGRPRSEAA